MSNKPSREEMKKFVEELVKNLAQKGIGVGGGAVLKFKDDGQIESVDGFGSLGNIDPKTFFGGEQKAPSLLPPGFKDQIRKMSKEQFESERKELKNTLEELVGKLTQKLKERGITSPTPLQQPVSESNEEVQEEVTEDADCTCPSCLNYDNFEEKLTKKGPNFDYAQIHLGGKLFKIKYHVSESGEENISMRDCSEDIDFDNSTTEALQLMLQEAVKEKKFDKAQKLLNAIQERKNKN